MRTVALMLLVLATQVFAGPKYVVEYAEAIDIPIICAAWAKRVVPSAVGCTFWDGTQTRMVIPHGSRLSCIYWHELRHVYEGNWHPGREASAEEGCNWRPPGWGN